MASRIRGEIFDTFLAANDANRRFDRSFEPRFASFASFAAQVFWVAALPRYVFVVNIAGYLGCGFPLLSVGTTGRIFGTPSALLLPAGPPRCGMIPECLSSAAEIAVPAGL